ncbi:MAG: rod shape-determining protein MreC [candidate division Zixibacteria bacterium]|nr:rod shape-determining protein MreC [candidate division Zixibacteria bacterium]MDD5425745.1 rod shape-determining protein MreC [candidate division Zixibacteria bacterium]
MNWISNLFSRYWRNFHFAAILILTIILMVNNPAINGLVSQVTVSVFNYPFFIVKNFFDGLVNVDRRNEQLQEALVQASVRISMLEEARLENERLRAVLGFEPPVGYSLIPAKVISVGGDKMPTAVVINRGLKDSLYINQPIINQEGLIGRIIAVSNDYASVQLLTDPTSRVAARVEESREMGIVKYSIVEGMVLDNFPIQGTIAPGNIIVSSGLGGIYPPGLKVGTVVQVVYPEEEPFCEVRLTPAVNFNSLEELFILKLNGL